MTIEALGSLGELVAAIATIATLAFLAVQIRQSTHAAQTAAESEVPQRMAEWHARITAQPDLSRIWDAAAADFGSLGPEDVRRFKWIVAELFLVIESNFYHYRGGLLSELSWVAKRDAVVGLLQNPIILDQWVRRQTPFSEEFRLEIDAHRDSSDIGWSHQTLSDVLRPE